MPAVVVGTGVVVERKSPLRTRLLTSDADVVVVFVVWLLGRDGVGAVCLTPAPAAAAVEAVVAARGVGQHATSPLRVRELVGDAGGAGGARGLSVGTCRRRRRRRRRRHLRRRRRRRGPVVRGHVQELPELPRHLVGEVGPAGRVVCKAANGGTRPADAEAVNVCTTGE